MNRNLPVRSVVLSRTPCRLALDARTWADCRIPPLASRTVPSIRPVVSARAATQKKSAGQVIAEERRSIRRIEMESDLAALRKSSRRALWRSSRRSHARGTLDEVRKGSAAYLSPSTRKSSEE